MRMLNVGLTLVVAIAICATVYAAKEGESYKSAVREVVNERIADLNLTEAQEAKIAEIRKESRPKILDAAKELGSVVQEEVWKVRAVLTPEQEEMLQAMRQERRAHRAESLAERLAHLEDLDLTDTEMAQIAAIRKEFAPKVAHVMMGLEGIWSPEQRKARQEALQAGLPRGQVRQVFKPTEEQQKKAEAVAKEVGNLVKQELQQIHSVLTKGQQEKLAALREERKEQVRDRFAEMVASFQELNLTEEQKASIQQIREQYRPKVQEAGNKLRGLIGDEVASILEVIKG